MSEETNYPDAREYYPKKFHYRYCGKLTHGIVAGGQPHKICNECAVPMEYSTDDEGVSYVRDADGSVSYA